MSITIPFIDPVTHALLYNITVYFGGSAGHENQRLQEHATRHDSFNDAIINIMTDHRVHLSGEIRGNTGGATGYIHMPRTRDRDLIGFSNIDETNHTLIIRCTGHTDNSIHYFNTRGNY